MTKTKLTGELPGARSGRLTITDEYIKTDKGEKKYLCRCDCGNEKYILERTLRYGGATSCGCLRKENARKAISHDLTGKVYGELTVLHTAENQRKNGGLWWTCQCSCGNLYDVPGTLLVKGRRTDCGRKNHEKNYASADISGRKFNLLTALYPTKERDNKGSVIWHCRCDCGNEVDVAYNTLVYSSIKSCGCQKKEHDAKLGTFLTHIADTSLDMVKSKKIPSDNTTGYKGVYLIKGKYVAKIVFQKKQYYLGAYDRIEDAAKARKEAEEILFDGLAAYYEKYSEKADADPKWAEDNPISALVEKKESNAISITFLPIIE
ncbi:MAG: hypothetical protein J6B48_02230 [Clostridia bacterium]|nr:hypothetical protein [Clostridia bacterium]